MDLEQYLEKDIIIFLDGKIERKENILIDREEEYGIYMARDYLKELSYALDNEELTKAKRLFDDLKTKFSTLPKNSLERKKVYSLLERMYDKIQNYVKIKEGKIEVIRQGDSEIFKDTTEKFGNVTNKITVNKMEMSPEIFKEFENQKHADLPIGSGKDSKSKDHQKLEVAEAKSLKNDNVSVESKILGKHFEKYDKVREEKEPESKQKDDLLYQDILSKRKSDGEYLTKKELSLENEMHDVAERLIDELERKLEEKDIDALRKEISREIMEELDKRFNTEKNIFSKEKEKMYKEILEQVYRKAKQVVSLEDDRLNQIDENMKKHEDIKTIYINKTSDTIMNVDKKEDNIENMAMDSTPDNHNKEDHRIKYLRARTGASEKQRYEKESLTDSFDDLINHSKHSHRSKYEHNHHNDENLRVMYEEAIYTMFQNEYIKAAKIFERILRFRPENKAAKIRLYECIEAIRNA